jgi:uncharacterized DUF497 family protein
MIWCASGIVRFSRTIGRLLPPVGSSVGIQSGSVIYEWDAAKAKSNRKKHGVSFEQATAVFLDPFAATYPDPDHSAAEHREITLGHTIEGRLIFVAHCQRGNRIRIISARPATTRERHQYEETTR